MCRTCGCSDDARPMLTNLQTGVELPLAVDGHLDAPGLVPAQSGDEPRPARHDHDHQHDHQHDHDHDHDHQHDHHNHHHDHDHAAEADVALAQRQGRIIRLEQEVLAKNSLLAERNRGWLAGRGILALNLISSPGSGKTTLLERTIGDIGRDVPISVIEGDQATLRDAERIQATGCKVVQINTGAGCHLEADMTARGLVQLDPPLHSVVMIENVGNLVCPALFDLGERAKVVMMSVTEGDDKPVKYPHAFRASQVMILNKIDLLPYVSFDVDRCLDFARQVNPDLRIFQISATRGDGLPEWYAWLQAQLALPTSL